MPWSNQSGGGGSGNGGGGGPWGQRGGPGGPWGNGPQGGGGGKGGPPDLEDIIRRGQDRLRGLLPGGGGTGGGRMGSLGILFIVLAAIAVWLATGFFTVRPNEVGIKMIFGRYVSTAAEGLSYNFPYPIGSVEKPLVTANRTIEIGMRSVDGARRTAARVSGDESLMLSGDENIVDIDFSLQWQVDAAKITDFVFNLQNPDGTVRAVAESAMREVIGRRNIQQILTTDRAAIEAEVKQVTQDTLNQYGAGVQIILVNLQKVDPPMQVIDSFRDVQAARQDQDRARNEAETYASKIVPEARGESTKITQAAEGYRTSTTDYARGAASRFSQVYEEYRKAPDVIRERIFLETMERVLGGADKTILDQGAGGQPVVPYLPLTEMSRRPAGPSNPQAQGAPR
jgi:membrane protease subunit HflK